MSISTIVLIALLLALAVWIGTIYQRLQSSREDCLHAWRDLEGVLDRRLDLLARLEAIVGASDGGPAGLATMREAREAAAAGGGPDERGPRERRLDHILPAVLEEVGDGAGDLPDLREELASNQMRLPFATQRYDLATSRYNEAIRSFPGLLVARVCRFRPSARFDSSA